MLTVCEVHCCAGTKVNGEMDWYGILQVEQTADVSSLKKQCRKLALVLHPGKNKFPGAEAAFKQIGEANMTLSDRAKHSVYDMKRRGNINQRQPGSNTTFWTICPKCCMKFQYYRTLLNKSIRCHNCLTYYTASEFVEEAVPSPLGSCANLWNQTGPGSGTNMTHGNGGCKSKQNEVQPENVNIGNMDKEEHPVKPSAANARRRRARKVAEESSVLDRTSTDSEDGDLEGGVRSEEQNAGPSSGRYPLRSYRMKQNVTYKEARIEDDDDFPGRKRARKAAQKLNFSKEDSYHRTPTSKGNFTSSSNDEYLQPQFHDFKKDRSIKKFKQQQQIWAVYGDDKDKYPKFYVKTQNVDVDVHVVRTARVKLHPNGEDEASWVKKQLPATCGRFKVSRETETFDSLASFSHIVLANDIGDRVWEVYDIYPRIGEVWAIYKDWNVDWTRADLKICKYYVAEILEVGNSVVKVVLLTKIAGYIAVFKRETGDEKMMEIPLNMNLRFSHQIPAYRLTNELGGALKGCWELDTPSVPDRICH